VHLVGFTTKKFVTMHGHMNAKLVLCTVVQEKALLKYKRRGEIEQMAIPTSFLLGAKIFYV